MWRQHVSVQPPQLPAYLFEPSSLQSKQAAPHPGGSRPQKATAQVIRCLDEVRLSLQCVASP